MGRDRSEGRQAMTVYVDDLRAPATVGRVKGRWSHLTADTPEELHEFAARLGLRREWFQARCKYGSCPTVDGVCAHFHYDVVDELRIRAISLGAARIRVREMGDIVSARRPSFRNADAPLPAEPEGGGVSDLEITRTKSGKDTVIHWRCPESPQCTRGTARIRATPIYPEALPPVAAAIAWHRGNHQAERKATP
jgi:hypothetical protein